MPQPARYHPITAILVGGGIAATLDITYAIIRNGGAGKSALWVLQFVGSGWLGASAFEGGVAAGVLGFASHYAILLTAAAIYLAASRRLPMLKTQWLLCGAIFGVAVYLVMNFVVVPVSAVPFTLKYTALRLLEGFAVHAAFVGLPIAWAAQRRGDRIA